MGFLRCAMRVSINPSRRDSGYRFLGFGPEGWLRGVSSGYVASWNLVPLERARGCSRSIRRNSCDGVDGDVLSGGVQSCFLVDSSD